MLDLFQSALDRLTHHLTSALLLALDSPPHSPAHSTDQVCDRIGGTETYKIIGARALRGADLDEWRGRVL